MITVVESELRFIVDSHGRHELHASALAAYTCKHSRVLVSRVIFLMHVGFMVRCVNWDCLRDETVAGHVTNISVARVTVQE